MNPGILLARGSWDDNGNAMVSAPSLNAAMSQLCVWLNNRHLSSVGNGVWSQVERRGGPVREFNGMVVVTIEEIRRRLCWQPARRINPWVSLAEFPWLIAGRNDISWLLPYLPRAADFSDDGLTWRAGYGLRLRGGEGGYGGYGGVRDQLKLLVNRLTMDPMSRQAVLSLWDSEKDYTVGSKDYPCTNWLHFMTRDQQNGDIALDLSVVMRSNDLFWGFSGVNVTNFTLLQELVAACIGLKPGLYRHACDNLHVYERDFDRLGPVAASVDPEFGVLQPLPAPAVTIAGEAEGALTLDWFTDDCRRALFMIEETRRNNRVRISSPSYWLNALAGGQSDSNAFLAQWLYFMSLHSSVTDWSQMSMEGWEDALGLVREPAWRLSAASLLERTRTPRWEGLLERVAAPILSKTDAALDYLRSALHKNEEKAIAST